LAIMAEYGTYRAFRHAMAAPPLHEGPPTYHPLLDDIDTFEGRSPTGEDLDEMARCCKEILPGPRAAVREEAARMPLPIAGRFRYVDVSSTSASPGTATWRRRHCTGSDADWRARTRYAPDRPSRAQNASEPTSHS